jgi:hypothetical protein
MQLTEPLDDAGADGAHQVTLDAILTTEHPEVVGSFPLARGSRFLAPGIEVRVDSIVNDREQPIWLDYLFVTEGDASMGSREPVEFVLVNKSLGLASHLHRWRGSGNAVIFPAGGVSAMHQRGGFQPWPVRQRLDSTFMSWLPDAEILVVKWTKTRSEPIRLHFDSVHVVR